MGAPHILTHVVAYNLGATVAVKDYDDAPSSVERSFKSERNAQRFAKAAAEAVMSFGSNRRVVEREVVPVTDVDLGEVTQETLEEEGEQPTFMGYLVRRRLWDGTLTQRLLLLETGLLADAAEPDEDEDVAKEGEEEADGSSG